MGIHDRRSLIHIIWSIINSLIISFDGTFFILENNEADLYIKDIKHYVIYFPVFMCWANNWYMNHKHFEDPHIIVLLFNNKPTLVVKSIVQKPQKIQNAITAAVTPIMSFYPFLWPLITPQTPHCAPQSPTRRKATTIHLFQKNSHY